MAEITGIVLGNIGSGKTTFLNTIEKRKTCSKLLPLLSMPGEIRVERESPEVLKIVDEKFYKNLNEKNKDMLFAIEIDILNARIRQMQTNLRQGGIVFNERCPYEDRYVFVANLYESGLLSHDHYEVYKREYNYKMRSITPPDLLIYLYTKPETAYKRRMEELRRGTGGLKSEEGL
ncbi:MAG: deoxynucleoside kinase, partial [Fervidobacterium sp.]